MKKGWTGKVIQRRTYALHQQSNFKMHRQNKYTLNTRNTQTPTCPESTALPRTSPLRTLYILPSRQITEMRHSTSNNPEIESSTGTEGNCTLHRYDELEGSWGSTNIWPEQEHKKKESVTFTVQNNQRSWYVFIWTKDFVVDVLYHREVKGVSEHKKTHIDSPDSVPTTSRVMLSKSSLSLLSVSMHVISVDCVYRMSFISFTYAARAASLSSVIRSTLRADSFTPGCSGHVTIRCVMKNYSTIQLLQGLTKRAHTQLIPASRASQSFFTAALALKLSLLMLSQILTSAEGISTNGQLH